jgi:hypothetical protein
MNLMATQKIVNNFFDVAISFLTIDIAPDAIFRDARRIANDRFAPMRSV